MRGGISSFKPGSAFTNLVSPALWYPFRIGKMIKIRISEVIKTSKPFVNSTGQRDL